MSTLVDPLVADLAEERIFLREVGSRPSYRDVQGEDKLASIDSLDLSLVKERLCLPMERGGEGWAEERAERVETEYKAFLKLHILFPGKLLVANVEIDEMWHQHILFTKMYHRHCQEIFGCYFHHAPRYHTTQEEADRLWDHFEETLRLFKMVFGIVPAGEKKADCCPFPCC